MPLPAFKIDLSYNIVPLATSVLGASHTHVTYAGALSYEMARLHDPSLALTHAKVVANVPSLNPDARAQVYHIFHNKTDIAQKLVLAENWISTATEITNSLATVSITMTAASLENKAALHALLSSLPSVISSFTVSYSG